MIWLQLTERGLDCGNDLGFAMPHDSGCAIGTRRSTHATSLARRSVHHDPVFDAIERARVIGATIDAYFASGADSVANP